MTVWDAVLEDMKGRDRLGRERYGRPLTPFNGRDALQDAYEEALDLAVYLKQAILERQVKHDPLLCEAERSELLKTLKTMREEVQRLQADNARKDSLIKVLSERIYNQAELLARRPFKGALSGPS